MQGFGQCFYWYVFQFTSSLRLYSHEALPVCGITDNWQLLAHIGLVTNATWEKKSPHPSEFLSAHEKELCWSLILSCP
jgi:hypothetical protein